MIRNRISFLKDGLRTRTRRWRGWRDFTVTETTEEADGIKSFALSPSDGGDVAPHRAGQFLTVRVPLATGPVVRCWSLSDYQETGTARYRLTVKDTAGSGASTWMHSIVKPGDRLAIRPPAGRFVLERGSFYRVVLISAGIGVTPLLSMLKAHAARGDEAPPLVWIHATRSGATHAFRAEIDSLIAGNPNFSKLIYYSAPEAGDRHGRDYDHAGRLTEDGLTALLENTHTIAPFGRSVELGGEHSEFYVCGPRPFEQMVRGALARAGVAPGNIRAETFGVSLRPAQIAPTVEFADIHFRRSRLSARWAADDDLTLLEFAESLGLAPESGCRMGTCQTCETSVLQGEVRYDVEPRVSPPAGRALLCCSRPNSAALELDL
jgi:ferredoxin-NADP reductase